MLLQLKISGVYFNIFLNVMYSCEIKTKVSASSLQASVSHDPSEIILISYFYHSGATYFCENHNAFSGPLDE